MDDDRTALGRIGTRRRDSCVATQPGHAVPALHRLLRAALQCAHLPAGVAQLARHLAADAAGGAEDQNRLLLLP